ncbi:hypothetical protein FTO60_09085 [Octadecabacter sp. SW4]|uniref:hypothetical protein n=1 Tax=Octadecabacter sp. SW4 TaxID=2602067 RepID=UPI0011C1FB09|nr:hypothetical protein [Octadecabacter sp. SW4]QEE35845.1 hypothetical protein FTO60_09085 [Octadecabacter sp. SW4]
MARDPLDPKGLIREAFVIDGIGAPECRSIFLDWALSLPAGAEPKASIRAMLAQYGDQPADHPMTLTLREGLADIAPATRRGGRAGRLRGG